MLDKASLSKTFSALLLSCCSLALSACGTLQAYPGPSHGATSVALLKPELALGSHVVLQEVNGVSVSFWQDRAEVEPGPLRLRVMAVLRHSYRTLIRRHEIEFEAVAGDEYTFSADWHLYGPRIQVFNRSGTLVAEALEPPPPLRVLRSESVSAGQ